MIEGIDVSHYQGKVEWDKVAASGRKFAICKASQGTTFIDPMFDENFQAVEAAGLVSGAYHFFDPKVGAIAQAEHFLSLITGAKSLLVALDVEEADGWDALTHQQIAQMVNDWMDTVQEAVHGKPLLYCGRPFAKKYLGEVATGYYPIWFAWDQGANTPVPPGWANYAIEQYTPKGQVPGIIGDVDLNRFQGDDLNQIIVPGNR